MNVTSGRCRSMRSIRSVESRPLSLFTIEKKIWWHLQVAHKTLISHIKASSAPDSMRLVSGPETREVYCGKFSLGSLELYPENALLMVLVETS